MVMYHLNNLIRLILLILFGTTLLVSCAQLSQHPVDFEEAIHIMVNNLLEQAKNNQEILGQSDSKKIIVLKPFVDANSKKVVKISQRIEQIIKSQKKFLNDFTIYPLTLKYLHEAQYIISGIIDFESVNAAGYNQILLLMTNKKTGKVLSNSAVWVPMQDLDSKPVSMYQTSPMYLTSITEFVTNSSVVQLTNQEFYDSLDTKALLAEAETAYEQQDYQKALGLFNLTTKRPEGQLVRTYANLYQTHRKLQDQTAAKKAFKRLLEASVQENNKLKQKFLFSANSTNFIDDEKLINEYLFWIQQIGEYFNDNAKCFHTIGHISIKEVNNGQDLALLRAQKIQQMLQENFPQLTNRSKPVSQERSKNIDTDNMFGTMDRRVEIVVVDCSFL